MNSSNTRQGLTLKVTAFMALCATLMASEASAVVFEGTELPVRVRTAVCDSAPRIIVEFADPSKNIWFPANAGDSSKFFLSTALTAKASGQRMYFFGRRGRSDVLLRYFGSASPHIRRQRL